MTEQLRFWDKLLPDQPDHRKLYRGDAYMADLFRLICRSSGIADPSEEFRLEQSARFTVEEMASNPVAMRFMQFLIRVSGAARVLEIGTFVGLSTMYFAKALPPHGEVVTIEKFDEFAAIAERNFALNGLADRIRLCRGDAFEIIDALPREAPFDLVFVDGNKERYDEYVVKTQPLLAPSGIIVVDDCFFHGDVVNPTPQDAKGRGARAFMDDAAASGEWLRVALPISNGIFLMTRA
ncbi:MAG TPA: O-methyltransferase [Stellaceae bacterium]|nr:O-methyltransferase [Stellaceae bacterium]